MADEEEIDELEDMPAKGSSTKTIIIVAILVLLSNGIWAGLFFVTQNNSTGAEAAAAEPPPDKAPSAEPGPLHELEPFVVNLNEPEGTSYLRVKINLELESESSKKELESRMVQLRDGYISLLSSQSVAQLRTIEDKNRLRADLLKSAQDIVSKRHIRAVYFTDFMMQ